jgi:DNA-binding NarL/FixJ family response regulator
MCGRCRVASGDRADLGCHDRGGLDRDGYGLPGKVAEKVRVLVVEDHRAVAELIEIGLAKHADVEVVGTAHDGQTAERLAAELRPDVILMDQHLAGTSGSDVALRVRQTIGNVAIVMLTGDDSDDAMLSAVEAGASGYLLKSGPASDIVDAVRRAAAGETTIPAATLTRLLALRRRREEALRDRPTLTAREQEVLDLMASGADNKTIAASLTLSIHTVRNHVESILEKLDAHSKLQAIAKAYEHGIIQERRGRAGPH